MSLEHDPDFAEFEQAVAERDDIVERCLKRIDVLEDMLDIMNERGANDSED